MRVIASLLLVMVFSIQAQAEYVSKFWLEPQAMQLQLSSPSNKSMVLISLEYDPLKIYLRSFEITHAGAKDPILSSIKGPQDMYNLLPLIDTVEHISMSHPRFGELTEDFKSYSIFGARPKSKHNFNDVDLIKRLLHNLFYDQDRYKNAVDLNSCEAYL